MLKINDTRDTGEKRLCYIEHGGFFEFDDVLCRRVYMEVGGGISLNTDDDDLAVMEMYTGKLTALDRNTYVTPIADKQIWLEIED